MRDRAGERGRALFILAALLVVATPDAVAQSRWYKGNTHAHTVLSGHADSSPEYVAEWYHDRGYNFLILSEHNIFIDPDSVELPANRREDFILVPGEEVTGRKVIHTTAMNIRGLVDWKADHEHKHVIIQSHVDSTLQAGGIPILNHPNYQWALTTADIRPVERLHLLELHNGHPHVHNFGDSTHASIEQVWDELLTDGMLIYGVSSDDAHDFQRWGTGVSNPGRGWVMVRADALTPDAVTRAMRAGDFYASSGIMLKEARRGARYVVTVDEEATGKEMASPYLTGHHVTDGTPGFKIHFIGPGGRILKSVDGTTAEFDVTDDQVYVRAKAVFHRLRSGGGYEAFYAWTQPFFTDERSALVHTVPTRERARESPHPMAEAAEAFIATLSPAEREVALYPFDADERYNWHFVPRARRGLPLKDMTPEQRSAAHALMASVLSRRGYLKATGIMSLEEVLRVLENNNLGRDQELYFFTLFGRPGTGKAAIGEDATGDAAAGRTATGAGTRERSGAGSTDPSAESSTGKNGEPWGWRLEGHHLSLNYSSVNNNLSVTPAFMGTNPARVMSGPRAGLRVLAAEEDLARRLLNSFSTDQRRKAIIAPDAPDDILTGTDRRPAIGHYEGIAASDMTAAQRGLLREIIEEYVGNTDGATAREKTEKIEASGFGRLHFAWAGGSEPGERHYYRIHGPTVVFEYDNTQNGANHVHTVWRDVENDFGLDLLKQHYEESAHHQQGR